MAAGRDPGASRRACQSTAGQPAGRLVGGEAPSTRNHGDATPRLPHVRATKGRRPGPWGFSATPGCAPSRRWRRGRAPAARRGWPAGEWRRGSRRMSSRRGGGRLAGLLAYGFGGDGGCKRSRRSKHPRLLTLVTYSCTGLAKFSTIVLYCAAPVIFPNS